MINPTNSAETLYNLSIKAGRDPKDAAEHVAKQLMAMCSDYAKANDAERFSLYAEAFVAFNKKHKVV